MAVTNFLVSTLPDYVQNNRDLIIKSFALANTGTRLVPVFIVCTVVQVVDSVANSQNLHGVGDDGILDFADGTSLQVNL